MTTNTHFTHLECSMTGETYEDAGLKNLSEAGKPLLARYDLDKAKGALDRDAIAARDGGFWKWQELLPVRDEANIVRLGEIDTPNIALRDTAAGAGAKLSLIHI